MKRVRQRVKRDPVLAVFVALGLVMAVVSMVAIANRLAINERPTSPEVQREVTKQVAPVIEQKVEEKTERVEKETQASRQAIEAERARNTELETRLRAQESRIAELEAREPIVVPSPTPSRVPVPVMVMPSPEPTPEPGPPGPTGPPGEQGIPGLPGVPFPVPTPQPPDEPGACRAVRVELITRPVLCLG